MGRALRGPVNTPVLVTNFAEFKRRFGDSWSRSSLGPAVSLFFEHGGKRLYVVRIANGARGSLLCVPASGSALVMRSVDPGSTERVRAAVDYDGIDDDECFNLTLQRIDPATGLVTDQEFFQRCHWQSDAEQFVGDALLSSTLARVEEPYPLHRPEATRADSASLAAPYVTHSQSGTDGSALSDYDLVGTRKDRSGLFALDKVEHFDTLYLPPIAKGVDTGAVSVMAAELYCRERGAMLLVDPPSAWATSDQAIDGMRSFGYRSANLVGYFPRMVTRSGDDQSLPVGGGLAGILCKQDRNFGAWQTLNQQGLGLARRLKPAITLAPGDVERLNRFGLNALSTGPAGRSRVLGSVTMGAGDAERLHSHLPVRRLGLAIVSAVGRATRWAVFEAPTDALAARVRGQVLTYLHTLDDLGAFASDNWDVQCRASSTEDGVVLCIDIQFVVAGFAEQTTLSMKQSPSGCKIDHPSA